MPRPHFEFATREFEARHERYPDHFDCCFDYGLRRCVVDVSSRQHVTLYGHDGNVARNGATVSSAARGSRQNAVADCQCRGHAPRSSVSLRVQARNRFFVVKLLRILTVLDAELDFVRVTRLPTLDKVLEERLRNGNVGPNSR